MARSQPIAEQTTVCDPGRLGKVWRRRWILGLVFLALVALVWVTDVPLGLCKMRIRSLLQRGRPRQAQAWVVRAGGLGRRDGEFQFLAARTARTLGDMDQARQSLVRAWDLGYSVPSLEREQTLALAQSGQFQVVESALPSLLLNAGGEFHEICEAYVIGYIRTYRIKQAERLLQAWLADAPGQPRALFLRATIEVEHFNFQAAEQDLRNVLKAVPDHAEAAELLAAVLLKLTRHEEALSVLEVALQDEITRPSAQLRQAECLRALGQSSKARELLMAILRETPDNVQAQLDLGTLESEAGEFEQAVQQLESALKLDPHSPDIRYAVAIALRGAGRMDEARPHFEYVSRAREALTEVLNLRQQVDENPGDCHLRYRIGATLLEYGQSKRGLVWLQSALDLNPRMKEAHQKLADYYESRSHESKQFAEMAAEHRSQAGPP